MDDTSQKEYFLGQKHTVWIVGAMWCSRVIGMYRVWGVHAGVTCGQAQAELFGDLGMISVMNVIEDATAGQFDL